MRKEKEAEQKEDKAREVAEEEEETEEDEIEEQDKLLSPSRLDEQSTKILEEEYFALDEGHQASDPNF